MSIRNPVADAIRQLRHNYQLTQVELAQKAGIPRATLALMENPRGNPSMASVIQVASALGVAVGDLLSHSSQSWVSIVKRSDMTESRLHDGLFTTRLLSPPSHGATQIYQVEFAPHCQAKGRAHAKGCVEYLYCLAGGELLLTVDTHVHRIAEGEMAVFPGHLPHSYSNSSQSSIQALVVIALE